MLAGCLCEKRPHDIILPSRYTCMLSATETADLPVRIKEVPTTQSPRISLRVTMTAFH